MRKVYVILRVDENNNRKVFGVFSSSRKAKGCILINKIADERFKFELVTEVLR